MQFKREYGNGRKNKLVFTVGLANLVSVSKTNGWNEQFQPDFYVLTPRIVQVNNGNTCKY